MTKVVYDIKGFLIGYAEEYGNGSGDGRGRGNCRGYGDGAGFLNVCGVGKGCPKGDEKGQGRSDITKGRL